MNFLKTWIYYFIGLPIFLCSVAIGCYILGWLFITLPLVLTPEPYKETVTFISFTILVLGMFSFVMAVMNPINQEPKHD